MNPFIGEIMMFGGNFAPRGWAFCDGQLLSIASNTALFSILGTTYGGDGRTTFGLPELRGRIPMHAGNGPGLTPRSLGQKFGTQTNNMNVLQMPAHNHAAQVSVPVSEDDAATGDAGGFLANISGGIKAYRPDHDATYGGGPIGAVVGNTGNNQPINNLQPTQVINYIIALQGIFPSRS